MDTATASRSYTRVRSVGALIAAITLLLVPTPASAQGVENIGNQFIRASLNTYAGWGRFWFTSGPSLGSHRFLYGNEFLATSNIIFRVTNGSTVHYYSNIPLDYPYRPATGPDTEVEFKPFDSLYRSPDTLAVAWNNMQDYSVTLRFIVEKTSGEFDRGSDIVMELHYRYEGFGLPGKLGIFTMLDVMNGEAGGPNESSVLTSRGYFPAGFGGRLFAPADSIPEFYHVGSFLHQEPLNTILAVHRLKGASHGGKTLTPPDAFAIGDWAELRMTAWELDPATLAANPFDDAATVMRWENLQGFGTLRTAFGANDREGNNFHHCRDTSLFAAIRTVRLVEQGTKNGPYAPEQFDLEMWLTNTDVALDKGDVTVIFDEIPELRLDPSTPAVQSVQIPAKGTRKLRWRLGVPAGSSIARADVPLRFLYAVDNLPPVPFSYQCEPVVTIRGYRGPGEDSLAPVVEREMSIALRQRYFAYKVYDRHPNYTLDTGVDTVRILPGAMNVTVNITSRGVRCSVPSGMELRANIIDQRFPAFLAVAAYDCRGNVTFDTLRYLPEVRDSLDPILERTISTSTHWVYRIYDRHPGFDYDTGIDTIYTLADRTENMELVMPQGGYMHCDTGSTVTLGVRVIDTTKAGIIHIMVADCSGNTVAEAIAYTPSVSGVDAPVAGAGARLSIAGVRPHPVTTAAGRLHVTLLNVRAEGAAAELIAIDGSIVASFTLGGGAEAESHHALDIPAALPSGLYLLRVTGENGSDWEKVIVR